MLTREEAECGPLLMPEPTGARALRPAGRDVPAERRRRLAARLLVTLAAAGVGYLCLGAGPQPGDGGLRAKRSASLAAEAPLEAEEEPPAHLPTLHPTAPPRFVAPKGQCSKANRTWSAWAHFDLRREAASAEERRMPVAEAKRHAASEGFAGFSYREGVASFRRAVCPFQQSDLTYVGENDSVAFFMLSPAVAVAWESFEHYDLPGAQDAEVLESADATYLQRYAEQHGYVGFAVRESKAYMKAGDLPLTQVDLTKMSHKDPVVFYISHPGGGEKGLAGKYYLHDARPSPSCATEEAGSCLESQCCQDLSKFCVQSSGDRAECVQDCERGSGSLCKVLGQASIPLLKVFCFAVAASEDLELLRYQMEHRVGLGACDDFAVFAPTRTQLAPNLWTYALDGFRTGRPGTAQQGRPDVDTVFKAWMTLMDRYIYRTAFWIVKVDVQTLFLPQQLKMKLRRQAEFFEGADPGYGIFLRTCVSNDDVGYMTRSLQVLSTRALSRLNFHYMDCPPPQETSLSEETWLLQCLERVGAFGVNLQDLLLDGQCESDVGDVTASCDYSRVAYHPVANAGDVERCLQRADSTVI